MILRAVRLASPSACMYLYLDSSMLTCGTSYMNIRRDNVRAESGFRTRHSPSRSYTAAQGTQVRDCLKFDYIKDSAVLVRLVTLELGVFASIGRPNVVLAYLGLGAADALYIARLHNSE